MPMRIVRWLLRLDIRPGPEEREPPPELAIVRDEHAAVKVRANRALTELHRLEGAGRGKHD